MNRNQNVAIYGLGNMGYLIAERLARHFPLQVFDLNTEQLTRACQFFGGEAISAPEELADTHFVVLSLPSPAASHSVLREIAPHLSNGTIVVETSTVNPEDLQASKKLLDPYGIRIVDASVLAGISQMQAGTATLLIGGSEEDILTSRPVLNAISEKQIHFGDVGAGAAAKVINNAVAHAVMVVVTEAGAMATGAGVSCEKLIGLLSDAQMGLHRPLTHRYAERIVQGNYAGGMPLAAARKDSILAMQLAQNLGVPLFAIQASHSVYDMAASAGHSRDDYAAIAKLWAGWGTPAVPTAKA